MPADNTEQIAEWNGPQGQRWATLRSEIDGIVVPFGAAVLALAAAQPGERVLDVGCGCGDTSIELAQRVGAAGRVLGVDVSRPMLDIANARAAEAGLAATLEFREADAAESPLLEGADLLFSRFGVMFFAKPLPAWQHLRTSIRPGGRCVFVCWRTPRDNAWTMTPLGAARAALGAVPPPADPLAPGPFAFADDDRLRGILAEAGFDAIRFERFDAPVFLGATPRAAAENAVRVGPTSRFAREAGDAALPAITEAIERALVPLAAADGRVSLNGSTWLVSAVNPVP